MPKEAEIDYQTRQHLRCRFSPESLQSKNACMSVALINVARVCDAISERRGGGSSCWMVEDEARCRMQMQ